MSLEELPLITRDLDGLACSFAQVDQYVLRLKCSRPASASYLRPCREMRLAAASLDAASHTLWTAVQMCAETRQVADAEFHCLLIYVLPSLLPPPFCSTVAAVSGNSPCFLLPVCSWSRIEKGARHYRKRTSALAKRLRYRKMK